MNGLIIRQAKKSDQEYLINLYKEINDVFIESKKIEFLKKKLSKYFTKPRYVMHLAMLNKIPIAYCSVFCRFGGKRRGRIIAIGVQRTYRRKGIGRRLIKYSCNLLKKEGMETVVIRTWSSNKEGLNMLEKLGFKVYRTRFNSHGKVHTLWLHKDIGQKELDDYR